MVLSPMPPRSPAGACLRLLRLPGGFRLLLLAGLHHRLYLRRLDAGHQGFELRNLVVGQGPSSAVQSREHCRKASAFSAIAGSTGFR